MATAWKKSHFILSERSDFDLLDNLSMLYLCVTQSDVGLVWFLCLMAYQLFLGYLMPKPFS